MSGDEDGSDVDSGTDEALRVRFSTTANKNYVIGDNFSKLRENGNLARMIQLAVVTVS